jgi:cellulose synthase/poly-beta-1,6-N-acetylglucosamine synthase-like glycosyltransferase
MSWSLFHWIAGAILGLAWFSRILDAALGMRQVADISHPEWDRRPEGNPRVSIIVPACNEEADIEEALNSLLALDYGNYEVIAVDDRSTDRTGEIMDRVGSSAAGHELLRILHVRDLPSGWLGKTHAMWTAGRHATGDWLLFTDADVVFRPDSIRRALAYAQAEGADHVVMFPRIIMKHAGERMMMAFFQTLFVFGHRPWKVAHPETKDHMGVGAFNLVKREVYEAVGTFQRLRLEVLDDMKLGKVVKCLRRRSDLAALGAWHPRYGAQLEQEFLRGAFVSVVAGSGVSGRACLSEPDALHWFGASSWMGARALCRRAAFHVPDLRWYVVDVADSCLLHRATSH